MSYRDSEKRKEYLKRYNELNKERLKQIRKENARRWYLNNSDKAKEHQKEYYERNKESIAEKKKEKYQEPLYRASVLLTEYNKADIKNNRGTGDITPEWIVENIFSKSCVHCGESDWHKLGCNRLDNSKPHTKDNVEPCCKECNSRENAIIAKRTEDGKFV